MPAKKPYAKLKCLQCGSEFEVMPYRAATAKYCSWVCGQKAKAIRSRDLNADKWRFQGEGKTYTKYYGKHMHRVVAETVLLGRSLKPGEIVHHIDGNKLNNDPGNLRVMTQSEHVRLHHAEMLVARKIKAGY